MKESIIESELRKAVESRGGRCFKWVSPGNKGVADRIALYAKPIYDAHTTSSAIRYKMIIKLIELKQKGKALSRHQKEFRDFIESIGGKVYKLDDINQIEGVLNDTA